MPSFPPILGASPNVLILGSMPSQISIRQQRYYANPNNAFWWILSKLCGFNMDISYVAKVAHLKQSRIAVWDVLFDCIRPGSLDTSIVRNSEQVNDFLDLIEAHPSLCLIAFNGRAAEQIFLRHAKHILSDFPNLETVLLPSTSPAHAAMNRQTKLANWKRALALPARARTNMADLTTGTKNE